MGDFGLLKRILRYIKDTITLGVQIHKDKDLVLMGYSDSDWAGCKETRRSTTGFCILLGSNLISWSAKRQPTVAKSSTGAEYRALTAAAQELKWISTLVKDLNIPQFSPTILHCDHLSAVYLSANPAMHNRSKHFDTDFHYIREQVGLDLIETQHIPASLQPLARGTFVDLRVKLGVAEPPTPSLGGGAESKPTQRQSQAHLRSPIRRNMWRQRTCLLYLRLQTLETTRGKLSSITDLILYSLSKMARLLYSYNGN